MTERPTHGGRYRRDPRTGALTRQVEDAETATFIVTGAQDGPLTWETPADGAPETDDPPESELAPAQNEPAAPRLAKKRK